MAGYMYLGNKKVCPAIVANEPVISSLNVTPSTSEQTIEAPSGTDGYNPIVVSAVTSSIDSNIIPENIKKDVTILNVTGTLEGGGQPYEGLPRYEVIDGVAQLRSSRLTGSEFDGIKEINESAFRGGFQGSYISGDVVFKDLEKIGKNGMYECFSQCVNLDGIVNLQSLKTIQQYGMYNSFNGCSGITTVYLTSLEKIGTWGLRQGFAYCTSITDIYFNSLNTTSFDDDPFSFNAMLSGTGTSITHTLHFPSNLEPTIQNLAGYPNFGGSSGYVVLAFDLPATE